MGESTVLEYYKYIFRLCPRNSRVVFAAPNSFSWWFQSSFGIDLPLFVELQESPDLPPSNRSEAIVCLIKTSRPATLATASTVAMGSSSMQLAGFPFMRLMEPDPETAGRTEKTLESIRHHIYFFLWNSVRAVYYQDDFVIDEEGISRNVQTADAQGNQNKAMADTGLLFANKKISEDFCEYIYTVSVVEVSVTVDKSLSDDTIGVPRQPWEKDFMSRLVGSHSRPFKQYSRHVNLSIMVECIIGKHQYHSVPIIDDVCDALDQWKVGERGGRLRIKAYFSKVETDNVTPEQMVDAALPLYRLYSSDPTLELWFLDREPSAPDLLAKFMQARIQTLAKWQQWAGTGMH